MVIRSSNQFDPMESRTGHGVASQGVRVTILDSIGVLGIRGLYQAAHDQVIVAIEIKENTVGVCPHDCRVLDGAVGGGGKIDAVLLEAASHNIVKKVGVIAALDEDSGSTAGLLDCRAFDRDVTGESGG